MWPTMTAEPSAPGRELYVYQPATSVLAGTCIVPRVVRPTRISRVRTPIAGIVKLTGRAAASGRYRGGGATARPEGRRAGLAPRGGAKGGTGRGFSPRGRGGGAPPARAAPRGIKPPSQQQACQSV